MSYLIGYSQIHLLSLHQNPFTYKTEVIPGSTLGDFRDYLKTNPEVYYLFTDNIEHNWGDQIIGPVYGYTQTNNVWQRVPIPSMPIRLRWTISSCNEDGTSPQPIGELITPLGSYNVD